MPRAMMLPTKQAVNEIANSLVNLGPSNAYQHRLYPYPGFGNIFFEPNLPSIMCRFIGIAEDSPTESELVRVPSALRFELRIIAVSDYGPQGVTDPYLHAQNLVLDGTDAFFSALSGDRRLNDLVLDIGVEGSIIDELVDPGSESVFYGHEMVMVAKLFV